MKRTNKLVVALRGEMDDHEAGALIEAEIVGYRLRVGDRVLFDGVQTADAP